MFTPNLVLNHINAAYATNIFRHTLKEELMIKARRNIAGLIPRVCIERGNFRRNQATLPHLLSTFVTRASNKNIEINRYSAEKSEFGRESIDYSFDADTEIIAKRVLLEIKNNDRAYIAKRLRFLIENLYRPTHLNVEFLTASIDQSWHPSVHWLKLVHDLSICVVEAENVNKKGEIQLDMAQNDVTTSIDVVKNIKRQTRLIAILKFKQGNNRILEKFSKQDESNSYIVKRKADIIISDKGVFAFNDMAERLEMLEYNGKTFEKDRKVFDEDSLEPFIDMEKLTRIKQQCI